MEYIAIYTDDYLMHHGVKGMKWGVRRYQNKDGTLTDAGKKRYGSEEAYAEKRARNKDIAKKVAIGVGVGVGIAAAVGTAYVFSKKYESLDTLIGANKTLSGVLNVASSRMKGFTGNIGGNAADFIKRKAGSTITKLGMTGRYKIAEGAKNAIREGANELTKAGIMTVAGFATKKITDAVNNKSVQNALKNSVDRSANEFANSVRIKSDKSNSGGNGNQKSKNGFSSSDENRYQQVFKNNKINNNPEARQTIKKMRKQGKSIDEIERYVNSL